VLELTLGKLGTFSIGILVSDVDFVTALCSQVVYEGLVDDTFRVKCGKCPHLLHLGGGGGSCHSLWCLPLRGRACRREHWWPREKWKASGEIRIAVPSALKGSVDFGPEVTSSDKSLKVLLNAEDKVRERAEQWACTMQAPLWEGSPSPSRGPGGCGEWGFPAVKGRCRASWRNLVPADWQQLSIPGASASSAAHSSGLSLC
jgi:hypothetical protein